jgi:hypothetical protein
MIGYMSIEEQVDVDFIRARRRAFLRRIRARLRKNLPSQAMTSFEETNKKLGGRGGVRLGRRVVRLDQIVGSMGRSGQFDSGFMPVKRSLEGRWKRVDRAFHGGIELQPVVLNKIGDCYYVLDGNHRVSVARYHGVEMIDAEVTEFRTRSSIRALEQPAVAGDDTCHRRGNRDGDGHPCQKGAPASVGAVG